MELEPGYCVHCGTLQEDYNDTTCWSCGMDPHDENAVPEGAMDDACEGEEPW